MLTTAYTYKPAFMLLYTVAAALVVYNVVRAINVSITYDEATTWQLYLQGSYSDIVNFTHPTANNHPLNSICAKFCMSLFGNGVLALRLPNVVAQLVYLYCAQALLRRLFTNQWFVLFSFLLLNLNPFLFDFWGQCRGYGMAIGLMMLSLHRLQLLLQKDSWANLASCIIAALLSVYSNFAMLNFYLAIIAVVTINACFKLSAFIKTTVIILTSTAVLYLLIAAPVQALRQHNELYYGGDTGLVANTLSSLIRESLFIDKRASNTAILITACTMLAQIVIAGCYWIYIAIRSKQLSTGLLFWGLATLPLLSISVQHHLLGNKYLIERTALFIYPLYALQLCLFIYHAAKGKYVANSITGVLATCLAGCFIVTCNTYKTRSWYYNQYDVVILKRMLQKQPGEHLRLKLYWEFTPSFDYYITTQHAHTIEALNNDAFLTKPTAYHYYYIHRDDVSTIPPNYVQDTVLDGGRFLLYIRK